MRSEEFTEQLASALKEQLEARGLQDVKTEFNDIDKANGGGYEAITVRLGDNPIGVNINASQLHDAYEHGADFDGVLNQAVLTAMSGLNKGREQIHKNPRNQYRGSALSDAISCKGQDD